MNNAVYTATQHTIHSHDVELAEIVRSYIFAATAAMQHSLHDCVSLGPRSSGPCVLRSWSSASQVFGSLVLSFSGLWIPSPQILRSLGHGPQVLGSLDSQSSGSLVATQVPSPNVPGSLGPRSLVLRHSDPWIIESSVLVSWSLALWVPLSSVYL